MVVVYLIQRKLELSGLVGGGETVVIIDSKYQSLVKGITEINIDILENGKK